MPTIDSQGLIHVPPIIVRILAELNLLGRVRAVPYREQPLTRRLLPRLLLGPDVSPAGDGTDEPGLDGDSQPRLLGRENWRRGPLLSKLAGSLVALLGAAVILHPALLSSLAG